MDAEHIIKLKREGVKIVNDPMAKSVMEMAVSEVFLKTGYHKNFDKEALRSEVASYANAILNDIVNDHKYRHLRIGEISYCFNNGLKGRLSNDKDIVIKIMTFLRWLEGYVNHEKYKEAIEELQKKPAPPSLQLVEHEYSDDDFKRDILEAYDDYKQYVRSSGSLSQDSFKTVSNVVGMPFSCIDYGKYRLTWLVKNGYAKEGEKLIDVFERARKNNDLIKPVM